MSISLESGMYLCIRLPEGSYPTEPNVRVSQNKVECKYIVGADCFHRNYPVDTCPIWEQALKKFREHLRPLTRTEYLMDLLKHMKKPESAQSQAKYTQPAEPSHGDAIITRRNHAKR